MGVAGQPLHHPLAQRARVGEPLLEIGHRLLRRDEELRHGLIAGAAPLDFGQPVLQRTDQRLAALRTRKQIVFEIRIAAHHPDVAQHLVQHARRTAGDALAAQHIQHRPHLLAQQADDDLAVGKRSGVVGNFPEAGGHGFGNCCKAGNSNRLG